MYGHIVEQPRTSFASLNRILAKADSVQFFSRSILSRPIVCASIITLLWVFTIGNLSADEQQNSSVQNQTFGKIAAGTKFETEFYQVNSGKPGPKILVVGGIHGNEPAGALAADQIRHWPIEKGQLLVIPRANVLGLSKSSRYIPKQDQPLRDLNRNFPGDGQANQARGELAVAIWKLVSEFRPDWVFDLHEGYDFNVSHKPPKGKSKSVGSSLIYFGGAEMDPFADRMKNSVNIEIKSSDRKFTTLRNGPINKSLARACSRLLKSKSMILETTYRLQPVSLRTRQHRTMVSQALLQLGVISRNCSNRIRTRRVSEKSVTAIGLFDGAGTSRAGIKNIVEIMRSQKNTELYRLCHLDFNDETLKQFDVAIFPGGSGSKQGKQIGTNGREVIREFIKRGNGVVGICAGAYLCSSHYSWSLGVVDSKVLTGVTKLEGGEIKQMWYRGKAATVKMEITKAGQDVFKDIPVNVEVRYQNGPIISPRFNPNLSDYKVLAFFRSENGLYPQQVGTMTNTPAIVSSNFGKGRVLSISPHPEATKTLKGMIVQAVQWVRPTSKTDSQLEE